MSTQPETTPSDSSTFTTDDGTEFDVTKPISGYKYALIIDNPYEPGLCFSGLAFAGSRLSIGHEYGASQEAICAKGAFHQAPERFCDCGFHAVYSKTTLSDLYRPLPDRVLLEVELSGTAELHADGLRAAQQQVIAATLPSECATCLSRRKAYGRAIAVRPKTHFGYTCYVGVCAQHVARYQKRNTLRTLDELSRELGVPVHFSKEPPVYSGKGAKLRRRDPQLRLRQTVIRAANHPLHIACFALCIAFGTALWSSYALPNNDPQSFKPLSVVPQWSNDLTAKGVASNGRVLLYAQTRPKAGSPAHSVTKAQHVGMEVTSTVVFDPSTHNCYILQSKQIQPTKDNVTVDPSSSTASAAITSATTPAQKAYVASLPQSVDCSVSSAEFLLAQHAK